MERRMCKACVLVESPPEITIGPDGVCSICAAFKSCRADAAPAMLETDFAKLVAQHRGKGRYDCLCMCSGGKDSTAALYYMKTRYKLNVLAFMFDHGFETEDAVANVRRAVEKLGVDFLFFRSTEMHPIFAEVLKSHPSAVLCHLCAIWYMDLTFKTAERYEIPIVIGGWTKGQSAKQPVMTKCACAAGGPEYARMSLATKEFLKAMSADPRWKGFPSSMEEVVERAQKRRKTLALSPHWFLPFDTEEYVETIRRELGWVCPAVSYPAKSTNCYLNFISVHNAMAHYGYTHYHVEMSRMIREGLMTRDEALELLKIDFDKELLNRIAKPLGHRFG